MPTPDIIRFVKESDKRHLEDLEKDKATQDARDRRKAAQEAKFGPLAKTHERLITESQSFARRYMTIDPSSYSEATRTSYSGGIWCADYITPPVALGELPKPDSYGHTHAYASVEISYEIVRHTETVEIPRKRFLRPDTVVLKQVPTYTLGAFGGAHLAIYTGTPEAELDTLVANAHLYVHHVKDHADDKLKELELYDTLFSAVTANAQPFNA